MPRPNKPDGFELNNLQVQTGQISPLSPLTPTIKLSRPPSSAEHHSNLSFALVQTNNGMDLTNGGFISNDSKKHVSNGNGVTVPVPEPAVRSISHKFIHGPSPADSWSSAGSSIGFSNGDGSNLHHRNGNAAFSISDCLMLPNSRMSKRHSLPGSLPLPGSVEVNSSLSGYKSSASSLCLKDDRELSNQSRHRNRGSTYSMSLLSHSIPSPSKSSASPWKRWFRRKPSNSSEASSISEGSWLSNNFENDDPGEKKPKLQDLVKSVARRVGRIRSNEVAPMPQNASLAPPPTTAEPNNSLKPTSVRKRLDSFAPSSTGDVADEIHFKDFKIGHFSGLISRIKGIRFPDYFDPLGGLWLSWLSIVTIAFLYNAIVIFLRGSFREVYQKKSNLAMWLAFDYCCDIIYILDMVVFRPRLLFFVAGQGITDKRCMLMNYTSSRLFKFDLMSLLPLDLFYILLGEVQPLLRLPRLLKFYSYLEFSQRFENKSKSAHGIRVFRMVCYLLYMIHLNTCLYYAMFLFEGIGANSWTYNNEGDAYTRCLFRSAKTLIVIGNLPSPVTDIEIIFMTVDFMVGVFVFASMIGQMRDISAASGATTSAFRRRMNDTMTLLKLWKLPESVQKRVRTFYIYSWDNGALLDERELLHGVPIRMQTDIAINVHMDTLSRVSLFRDCDKMLLRDLVLKLRPAVYLPGEFICRKGAVGKEMYIVKDGSVQVLGGENNSKVLATLHPGSVFGEISLLSVGVGNRRTADVYSPGYANLFVLDKKDLQEVVVNYPDAQENLKRKAREILRQNQASDSKNKKRRGKSLIAESILTKQGGSETPSFFNAVLQVARTHRITATILKGSFQMSADDNTDKFVYFSSSDISTDDEAEVPIKKRRRPRFTKKRVGTKDTLKAKNTLGASSSMDGRSDSDCPGPMDVVVHPVPKDESNPLPGVPNVPLLTTDNPLPVHCLDQALPSPGLSSTITDNEHDHAVDQDAQDSGVDVPLNSSAGALNGGSFDEPSVPEGKSMLPTDLDSVYTNPNREVSTLRSEHKIEILFDKKEGSKVDDDKVKKEVEDAEKRVSPLFRATSRNEQRTPQIQPQSSLVRTDGVCRVEIEGEADDDKEDGNDKGDDGDDESEEKVERRPNDEVVDMTAVEQATNEYTKQTADKTENVNPEKDEDAGSSVDPKTDSQAAGPSSKKMKRSLSVMSQKSLSDRKFKANVQYDPRSIYVSATKDQRPKSKTAGKSRPKSGKARVTSHSDKQKKE